MDRSSSKVKELQSLQQETDLRASLGSKTVEVISIQQAIDTIRSQLQEASADIDTLQMRQVMVNEGLQRQREQICDHTTSLKLHESELNPAETYIDTLQQQQQSSVARLAYANEMIKVATSEHESMHKLLNQSENVISALAVEEHKLSEDLTKTDQLVEELSHMEKATAESLLALQSEVGQVKSEVRMIQSPTLRYNESSKLSIFLYSDVHVHVYHGGKFYFFVDN